eukprot:NODE_72_length_24857_cov_0.454399.p11 type:complete len:247 gc:universal NODE_72_length_24857_cov_0.454399:10814-11554(+)
MLFTSMINAIAAKNTPNPYQHSISNGTEVFSVTHNYTKCEIITKSENKSPATVKCGYFPKLNQVKFSGKLPYSYKSTEKSIKKIFFPHSLDFIGNSICVINTAGSMACGTQFPDWVSNGEVTLKSIPIAANNSNYLITSEVRFSPTKSFMCVTGYYRIHKTKKENGHFSTTDIYCTPFGKSQNGKILFINAFEWIKINSLTNVNAIVVSEDNICGRIGDEIRYSCISVTEPFEKLANARITSYLSQ